MSQRTTHNYVRLGLFVAVGLGCLVVTLYMLGQQQRLFNRSILVQADFRNVSGLLAGNNVRLGGIAVGNVRTIEIRNDSTVRVTMRLNQEVRAFVHQNTLATIGTDGLVGNTIINLNTQPGPALPIGSGDVLPTSTPASFETMLGPLAASSTNLVAITHDLRQMTQRLNGSQPLWQLLDDRQLAGRVRRSLGNVEAATGRLSTASRDVQLLAQGVRQGHGAAGYLLTNKALGGQLDHAARQLAGTSDTLAATLAGLRHQLQGAGALNTLLADTAFSRQLRQSMHSVELGTAGFSRSMEALQHNFLLRGYLRRQQRRQQRAQVAHQP